MSKYSNELKILAMANGYIKLIDTLDTLWVYYKKNSQFINVLDVDKGVIHKFDVSKTYNTIDYDSIEDFIDKAVANKSIKSVSAFIDVCKKISGGDTILSNCDDEKFTIMKLLQDAISTTY